MKASPKPEGGGHRTALLAISAVLAACSPATLETQTPADEEESSPTRTIQTVAAEPAPAPEVVDSEPADAVERAVAAPDRDAADRALDPQRQPQEMLRFFGVAPGQRVAELAAGGGYTAELLARVVGERGRVFGQNSPFILERFAEQPWSERLRKPVMKNVVRVDSEFESPLPEDATELDAVFLVLFYHDTVWFETDRAQMNRAVFEALRPGGIFAIVDHSAKVGAGVSQAKTLHRIEESVVRREVSEAGFVLDAAAEFLRNPEDALDWNAAPSAAGDRRGTSDRFVLRFVKPGP